MASIDRRESGCTLAHGLPFAPQLSQVTNTIALSAGKGYPRWEKNWASRLGPK